jgi:hypothetical protein
MYEYNGKFIEEVYYEAVPGFHSRRCFCFMSITSSHDVHVCDQGGTT